MSVKLTIRDHQSLSDAVNWFYDMARRGLGGGPVVVELGREKRSLPQNNLMWALLTDISEQIEWHGERLKPEDFKDICTAAVKGQKLVPGVDGGLVALGQRTSKMSKQELSELIEYLWHFGVERDVKFKENTQYEYEEWVHESRIKHQD